MIQSNITIELEVLMELIQVSKWAAWCGNKSGLTSQLINECGTSCQRVVTSSAGTAAMVCNCDAALAWVPPPRIRLQETHPHLVSSLPLCWHLALCPPADPAIWLLNRSELIDWSLSLCHTYKMYPSIDFRSFFFLYTFMKSSIIDCLQVVSVVSVYGSFSK